MVSDTHYDEQREVTAEFEHALETLLIESFAKGAAVEGTWIVTLPSPNVPDWTIEVRRREPTQDPTYEPIGLEEDE